MCLIIVCPAGTLPSLRQIANAMAHHSDGWGVGIARTSSQTVEVWRGLGTDPKEAWELMRRHAGVKRIIHFRYATHGAKSLDNVHPFWTGMAQDCIIAHNGIIPGLGQGERSDTREYVEDYLTDYNYSDVVFNSHQIDKDAGSSLIACLGFDAKGKAKFHLGRRSRWVVSGGMFYSNRTAFERPYTRSSGKGTGLAAYYDLGDDGLREAWPEYYRDRPAVPTGKPSSEASHYYGTPLNAPRMPVGKNPYGCPAELLGDEDRPDEIVDKDGLIWSSDPETGLYRLNPVQPGISEANAAKGKGV